MKRLAYLALLAGTALAATGVQGKTLALEGSDATSFHGDATYTKQLFTYLREGSPKPVLVFGSVTGLNGAPADTVYTTNLSGLSVADYSALYIQSPGGCCGDNRTGSLVYEAQITSFYAAGGSLAIQDYQGGDWGTILGFVPPSDTVFGFGTAGGGSTCFDTEVFLPNALSKGFTQPGVLGCWGHQAYKMSYFSTLGFVSLVDSGSAFGGPGEYSSFLALGGALAGGIPEPSSWAMLIAGFGLVGASMRRRAARPVAA